MIDEAWLNAGPTAWRNWQAHVLSGERHIRFETALYSDAEFIGYEAVAGPFTLMNTLAQVGQGGGPVIVVRTDWYLEWDFDPNINETDDSRYVGGSADDELAALLSLATGARIRVGGTVRQWRGEDPLGRPVEYHHRRPTFPPASTASRVIPSLFGQRNLESVAELLSSYGSVEPADAVRLARAARLYANAIWAADSDPNLSWLLLVSAVETAASTGTRGRGATKRFCGFVVEHAPGPPRERAPWTRVEWANMEGFAQNIYDKRSRALHDGRPFPEPMLRAPRWESNVDYGGPSEPEQERGAGYIERPDGIATFAHDAVWSNDDIPMLLWVFEYVVRGALVDWWRQLTRLE